MRTLSRSFVLVLAPVCVTVAVAQPALNINPNNIYEADSGQATTTATIPTLLAPPAPNVNSPFSQAFKKFQSKLGNGSWKFYTGANLGSDTSFTVDDIAFANGLTGGVTFTVGYTPGQGAPNKLFNDWYNFRDGTFAYWIQCIATNDPLGGNTSPYLDIFEGTYQPGSKKFGPPLYPYQYPGSGFYDQPARTVKPGGPPITWTAYDYLCTWLPDYNAITVYAGIQYSFTVTPNAAPEPEPLLALAVGCIGLLARRRRHS